MKALNVVCCLVLLAGWGAQSAETLYDPKLASGTLGSIDRLDPDLDDLIGPEARIEVLARGFDWSEGPVWMARRNCLLFSDVPRNVVWRWSAIDGLSVFLRSSGSSADAADKEQGSNGLTFDNDGRLILCQHGDRQVARLSSRRRFVALATNYQGKRLNSPNDVVLRSNGDLYFTDPPYGLEKGLQDPRKQLPFQGVYSVTRTGKVRLLTRDISFPNGLAFSPDEQRLYIANSDPQHPEILVYEVHSDGSLANGRRFFDASPLVPSGKGLPDGLKVDRKGNVWSTGPGGVLILTPTGRHLGTLRTGEATGNCAWGDNGSVLYMTADEYLCRVKTRTLGILPGPLAER